MKNTDFYNQKWDLTEKITLAKEIQKLNPDCLISGSLALWLQGIDLRRKPNDIDVYMPSDSFKTLPEGYKEKPGSSFDMDYPDEDYEVDTYQEFDSNGNTGSKIDFLVKLNEDIPSFQPWYCIKTGLRLVEAKHIILFKIQHALDDSFSRYKHKDDIIHMMVNS